MKLLLASRSAARRQMLIDAAIPFEPVRSRFDEEGAKPALIGGGLSPIGIAEALARLKAQGVEATGSSLVLGADQLLETADGSLLSKPGSREEAREQLRRLSGHVHHLHSSACLVQDGAPIWTGTQSVSLHMRRFSDSFLEDYLDREYEEVRWNVGVYRIEGFGIQLFDDIEGSHFAILGLPLLPLIGFLRRIGFLQS